jgi:hypothetical protein
VAADDIGDFILGGGHQNLADIGFNGTLPDMDNHGNPMNIGQGFSRQAHGSHAGGDDDYGIIEFNHGLDSGRGKLFWGPYTYCRAAEKQLVSGPHMWFQRIG